MSLRSLIWNKSPRNLGHKGEEDPYELIRRAREIFKTMPDNEQAKQWLADYKNLAGATLPKKFLPFLAPVVIYYDPNSTWDAIIKRLIDEKYLRRNHGPPVRTAKGLRALRLRAPELPES